MHATRHPRRSPLPLLVTGLLAMAACQSEQSSRQNADYARGERPMHQDLQEWRNGPRQVVDGPRPLQRDPRHDQRGEDQGHERPMAREEHRGRDDDGRREEAQREHEQHDRIHLDLHARIDRLTERLEQLERRLGQHRDEPRRTERRAR